MKKLFTLLFILLTICSASAGPIVLFNSSNQEVGTASNPIYVSGSGGGGSTNWAAINWTQIDITEADWSGVDESVITAINWDYYAAGGDVNWDDIGGNQTDINWTLPGATFSGDLDMDENDIIDLATITTPIGSTITIEDADSPTTNTFSTARSGYYVPLCNPLTATSGNGVKLDIASGNICFADNGAPIPSGDGTGDVVGPDGATDNGDVVFDTTTGKLIKDSGCTTVAGVKTCAEFNSTGDGPIINSGAEGSDAALVLDADEGDDAADTWTINSESSNNNLDFINDTNIRMSLTAAGVLQLGTAGVSFTQDGDGALTILGMGNGSDEDLTFNFDDTSNQVDITSSTGVTSIDFNSIALMTPTLINPLINDENGNEQLRFLTASSAVNYLQIDNAATGLYPGIEAKGDNTNIGISLVPKGTGYVYTNNGVAVNKTLSSGSTFTSTKTNTTNYLYVETDGVSYGESGIQIFTPGGSWAFLTDNSSTSLLGAADRAAIWRISSGPVMTFDYPNVGIGTTSPSEILEITSADSDLTINSTTDASTKVQLCNADTECFAFENSGNSGDAFIGNEHNSPISFYTNDTTRMTIQADGDVDINDLTGTYGSGSAYVCVNNSGELFASESACP